MNQMRSLHFQWLYKFSKIGTTVITKRVVMLSHSIEELFSSASSKFGIQAKRLFTVQGGEIDDTKLIRDEDVLYVSAGEPFSSVSQPVQFGAQVISSSSIPSAVKSGLSACNPDWLLLNVGGRHFATTRSTLVTKEPNSMLACMFAAEDGSQIWPSAVDRHGAFLIDRSPSYFEPILNYLRHGELILDKNISPQGVLEEARFFGIESLIPILENMTKDELGPSDHTPLTRREIINTLISTPYTSELRFQGVNLAEADLSRLDLRHINFKYANLRQAKLTGANLSYCCLERTDLSNANLEPWVDGVPSSSKPGPYISVLLVLPEWIYSSLQGAILLGVKMLCANLEGANLRSCNMEDPAGNRANMEGVNLKGANLEGSQMAGVNLRVATLKNANLQNCDLRGAVLAGADLENCDLSGSDLHEANLRGANLKDAAFELMLTPLHMSQAIR